MSRLASFSAALSRPRYAPERGAGESVDRVSARVPFEQVVAEHYELPGVRCGGWGSRRAESTMRSRRSSSRCTRSASASRAGASGPSSSGCARGSRRTPGGRSGARGGGNEELPDDLPAASTAASQEVALDHHRARALLDDALAALEPDLRLVFVLHELERMTGPEIAEIVGAPLGTVGVAAAAVRARSSPSGWRRSVVASEGNHERFALSPAAGRRAPVVDGPRHPRRGERRRARAGRQDEPAPGAGCGRRDRRGDGERGTATVGTATTGTALGASTKGAIGAATFLKIGGAVAIVGALAGGAWTATHPAEPVETAPVPVTTAPVMAAPHASPDPREPAPVPVASAAPSPTTPLLVPPLPVVSRSAPRPVSSVAPIAPPVSSGEPPTTASPSNATHDLQEEARALATARQSLAHGDNRGALEALDRYDAQYPDGQLRPEASILRARATTPAR